MRSIGRPAKLSETSVPQVDEAEAELALGDAHRALQFRQTREEAAEREGVEEERSEDLAVRGQALAEAAKVDRAHGVPGRSSPRPRMARRAGAGRTACHGLADPQGAG